MENKDDRRDLIIDYVKREFIGPDPIEWEGLRQENGEEILVSDPPSNRYIAGVLYPRDSISSSDMQDIDDPLFIDDAGNSFDNEDHGVSDTVDSVSTFEYLADAEVLIDRSNAYNQSAMSMTVAINDHDVIKVSVSAGKYIKHKAVDSEDNTTISYYRKQIAWESDNSITLPNPGDGIRVIQVMDDGIETGLCVDFTFRMKADGFAIYTITLENTKEKKEDTKRTNDEDCFFQTELILHSEKGFHPLPDATRINTDEDYETNNLLYRNVHNYAIGHGCGTNWEDAEIVTWVATAVFPEYEVKPILPKKINGVDLSMKAMSDPEQFKDVCANLYSMCKQYGEWIDKLENRKTELSNQYRNTAERHLNNCRVCYERMVAGIKLLEQNGVVRQAFQWMNLAMLLQQLHYNLPLQKWVDNGQGGLKLDAQVEELPDPKDESTWYDAENRVYGQWRPFQIAFILMNLQSMFDTHCDERHIVDLIWFPTGGGKTEAYLGLSAYTILMRRLKKKDDYGTSIIMRYTLRLLTAQQYERASAMICACEAIRKENADALGSSEISIGLWVGGDTTPNTQNKANSAYSKLKKGESRVNPFVILKCPWCGAQMGVVEVKNGKDYIRQLQGYRRDLGPRRKKHFVFRCNNEEQNCMYAKANLPLYVIDEDIYEKCPTLVLGTVDKFAMLPFRPEARGLFGFQDGIKKTSPDLIIQDELHLISGPLGSMVGHYETMIRDLCKTVSADGDVYPKIVASTATISRAKEQCHALYGCDRSDVFQFPPAGFDAGDSFFAEEDKAQNGRKYVGILASNSPSDATTAIWLYAVLLYATKKMRVKSEEDRDPYWTNMGYYNSIRELGQARTWIKADIDQHLDVMYRRRYDDKKMERAEYNKYRRYIWRDEELTSRIPGDQVTASLANLSITYPPQTDEDGKVKQYPIDICLATNMISVGLDVSRLGLMTVAGQPKTTSEYIQATSRVGRDGRHGPGLVCVLYRPGRPRDKSYYEHFKDYHSKLYCNVEPTSVTPFSSPVRERALHAIMIGMMRLESNNNYNENPPIIPDKEMIDHVKAVIEEKITETDPSELKDALNQMEYVMQRWEDWSPQKWTPDYNSDMTMGPAVPLIYPNGTQPNEGWNGRGMATPTSMRNVDSTCEANILLSRYESMEE